MLGMEYEKLLNLGAELGRTLMNSGAEIYRVEESVSRLLTAYGLINNTTNINKLLGTQCVKQYSVPTQKMSKEIRK